MVTKLLHAGLRKWCEVRSASFCDLDPVAQLYLRTFFNLFLSPYPRGVPRKGPDCRFPSEAEILGRIRGGNFSFNFDFDRKYSWGRDGSSEEVWPKISPEHPKLEA